MMLLLGCDPSSSEPPKPSVQPEPDDDVGFSQPSVQLSTPLPAPLCWKAPPWAPPGSAHVPLAWHREAPPPLTPPSCRLAHADVEASPQSPKPPPSAQVNGVCPPRPRSSSFLSKSFMICSLLIFGAELCTATLPAACMQPPPPLCGRCDSAVSMGGGWSVTLSRGAVSRALSSSADAEYRPPCSCEDASAQSTSSAVPPLEAQLTAPTAFAHPPPMPPSPETDNASATGRSSQESHAAAVGAAGALDSSESVVPAIQRGGSASAQCWSCIAHILSQHTSQAESDGHAVRVGGASAPPPKPQAERLAQPASARGSSENEAAQNELQPELRPANGCAPSQKHCAFICASASACAPVALLGSASHTGRCGSYCALGSSAAGRGPADGVRAGSSSAVEAGAPTTAAAALGAGTPLRIRKAVFSAVGRGGGGGARARREAPCREASGASSSSSSLGSSWSRATPERS
mmetsp:Transcript_28654/g.67137  ORF Transcript_28654/g.67137 Transcript_28654/m.67137 type:complete len:463 (-) Transcript_28654:1233-2621(-)